MSDTGSAPTLHRAYLVLGSNIDAERCMPAAVRMLERFGRIVAVSPAYESAAFGPCEGQANYVNAAVLLETSLSAEEVCKTAVPIVETELGRVRDPNNRYASRTIDVDLMLYDDAELRVEHRVLPSDEVFERAFVGIPLADVDPDYAYPGDGRTLQEIACTLDRESLRVRDDISLQYTG